MKQKIEAPNYTQIPNVLFDEYMKTLNGSEYKIISAIARKTFGWHKEYDRISYSQISEITGISSKETINKALKILLEKNYIIAIKNNQSISYAINITENEPVQKMNRYENCTSTGTKTVPVEPKTGTETVHTKESNINKLSKEIYEEIEKAYESCFYEVKTSGKLFIDFPRIRKRIKELLERITKDEIISVIQNAKTDDWIKDNGFQFSTILSDFQVAKLLNGKPEGRRGYSKPLPVQTRTAFLDMED